MAKANRMQRRRQRHARVRRKIQGTSARPRLNVYRSTGHIYAQIIDDEAGHTVASASTLDKGVRAQLSQEDSKREEAKAVGKVVAERAREQGHRERGVRPGWVRLPRSSCRAGGRQPRGWLGLLRNLDNISPVGQFQLGRPFARENLWQSDSVAGDATEMKSETN